MCKKSENFQKSFRVLKIFLCKLQRKIFKTLKECSILVRISPFSPLPPNYQGVYLRAQMELGGLLGHFWTLNQVKFRLVTFLGMFGKLKILPKQKHFFFATFFTLTAVLGYPLEIWSLKGPDQCIPESAFFLTKKSKLQMNRSQRVFGVVCSDFQRVLVKF